MISVVGICNLALANLGAADINALDEPTAEARACNLQYEQARDALVAAHAWRFAGKTESLAQLSTNPKLGRWQYAYARPADCLKILWVRPTYGALPAPEFDAAYEVEGETLFCDLSPALLRYVVRQTDPTKFPPLFVEALVWHLTSRLAMPITRDPRLRADAEQRAMRAQAMAESADANEARELDAEAVVSSIEAARL